MKISLAVQGIIDPEHTNYSDRINLISKFYHGVLHGIDIGFFAHQVDTIVPQLSETNTRELLRKFQSNSIHVATVSPKHILEKDILLIVDLCNSFYQENLISSLSVHLDILSIIDRYKKYLDLGISLLWENTDKDAQKGNTFIECKNATYQYPDWNIVYDIAHGLEMEKAGEPAIEDTLKFFDKKVKQLHVSWPENLYPRRLVGDEFTTSHSFLHLAREHIPRISSLLGSTSAEMISIEGVVPPGDLGKEMIIKEVDFIRNLLTQKQESKL